MHGYYHICIQVTRRITFFENCITQLICVYIIIIIAKFFAFNTVESHIYMAVSFVTFITLTLNSLEKDAIARVTGYYSTASTRYNIITDNMH